jgi:hypothetical protein
MKLKLPVSLNWGFAEHLFDIFDVEQHGYISIQELVGGLRLLWQ